jgi:V/A-type H+-transporting ATPase subunit I
MIQKMKKLTFLIYYKEYDQFLKSLQKLGVIHVQESNDQSMAERLQSSDEIREKEDNIKSVHAVIEALTKLVGNKADLTKEGKAISALQYLVLYDSIIDSIAVNNAELQRYQKDYETLLPWGSFDRNRVASLEEKGIKLSFYQASGNFMHKHPEYADGLVSKKGKTIYFVHYDYVDSEDVVPAMQVQLPEKSLEECIQRINELHDSLTALEEQKMELAMSHLADIKAYETQLINELAVAKAQYSTSLAADKKIMVVEGWYPETKEAEIDSFLKGSVAYYEVRDAVDTDVVPIQLNNDPYSRMFERLTKMYGFPSYNEWDPTPIVAPFFTLFFAICMGDAGYGIVIALYGLLGMAGKTKKVPIIGEMLDGCESMICALGVATTIVGFLLGTFFGINIVEAGWIPSDTMLGGLLTWLQGNVPGTSYSIQMAAAICIGVFHICLAMVIKAALYTKKEGFASQISTWGWVLLLVGGIVFGVIALVLGLPEDVTKLVLICIGGVSAIAIFLLNNVGRIVKSPVVGILVNPLAGLYDTYNMASGLMGDVLSYIRLYALCLAGGMLGGAFNMIGDMIGANGGAACVGAFLVYVIGHIFNLLMSAISAFVHPLRLNFVEYFKNAGYEGKGVEYKPFKSVNK